jgi:CRISPR system Cascade subunit CasE
MNETLYMVQLRLNPERLIRFAQDQGINRAWDEDLGYCIHAWLAALFGALAPKPFRLFDPSTTWHKDRPLKWFGYSAHDGATLREQAETFASPLALAVCDPAELSCAKRMPTAWATGRRLGFEVLTCPVSRRETEKDVFLRAADAATDADSIPSRAEVYSAWLARQWGEAATLQSTRLEGFRLVRMMRRMQPNVDSVGRPLRRLMYPQALLHGELTVADGAAFAACLARGIGRQRAFGYGMVLLRPLR